MGSDAAFSKGSRQRGLWSLLTDLTPEQTRSLKICVAYATASITISMIYKAILSTWNFDAKFTLLTAQAALSLAFCIIVMEFWPETAADLHLRPFDMKVMRKSLPLGVLYVANIAVGWFGLQLVDVPMFLAIRRTATAFTLGSEFFMLGAVPSPLVQVGVLVIVLGTVIAGWETFNSDFVGYAYTLGNNVVTAVQLAFAKQFKEETGIQGFGLVYYNALTALPLAVLGAALRGEVAYVFEYEHVSDPRFIAAVFVASALGCFMTYIVLLCATVNSPTVTSVTGNIKDIATTFIGAALFPGFEATFLKVAGLLVSFSGSGMFTYAKLRSAADSQVHSEPPADVQAQGTASRQSKKQRSRLAGSGSSEESDDGSHA
ncbi:hypothetical protein FNF29_01378 [Cafeteria roenbergensis]|uniref:Sugar phosphate transporter domain-containing protein n=2 Tax=Cafeteria roenbergensis TaxID=33653 RepID=A0A5A8CTD0_CAFRO|nr:hypothetical protein FNF29_01378 [Cafeteria roenbergensis]KAA0171832.1 hypothetical protein FNF28_00468 [Cafeteria roenbergensis]|eukprot:KAA0155959.1 hypothetical protein FNF29_01378 [Cafeteria roenbergensis]